MPERSRIPNEKPEPVYSPPAREKDPNAVALGRKGGLKGGPARAAAMTSEQRSDAARHAAKSRWKGGKTGA